MFKGWVGEKKTELKLKFSLNSDVYFQHHNIVVPSLNGTTQIDHVLVSPYGLFIVETKNLSGWIFGTDKQSTWTQVIYKSKHKFQNPLRQTYRHKKVLSKYLRIKEIYIHQVISFVGDCQFKTDMPPNVIQSGLGAYIKQFNTKVFSIDEVNEIQNVLSRLKSEVSVSTERHIQSLYNRHNSNTICPRCGSNLVERTVKIGSNKGSQFLGCADYPKCRFTKEIPKTYNQKEPPFLLNKLMILIIIICVIYFIANS